MPNGLPEPALSPLHPDKPEPPIVAGDVWQKIATGKTSVNAPRCKIVDYSPTLRHPVGIVPAPPALGTTKYISERVFRRDWRPC